MAFLPYLILPGTCREAFTRYQQVFGGELQILPMADAPGAGEAPDVDPDLVAHVSLLLDDTMLMGSDDPTGDGRPMSGAAVHFTASGEADARRIFDELAEGGEVTMPFGVTFWSRGFGSCTDRFGVTWMIDAGEDDGSG